MLKIIHDTILHKAAFMDEEAACDSQFTQRAVAWPMPSNFFQAEESSFGFQFSKVGSLELDIKVDGGSADDQVFVKEAYTKRFSDYVEQAAARGASP